MFLGEEVWEAAATDFSSAECADVVGGEGAALLGAVVVVVFVILISVFVVVFLPAFLPPFLLLEGAFATRVFSGSFFFFGGFFPGFLLGSGSCSSRSLLGSAIAVPVLERVTAIVWSE